MNGKATLVKTYNPLNPRDRQLTAIQSRQSVAVLVDKHDDLKGQPFVCILNGEPLLRQYWEETIIRRDDVVVLFRLPKGGTPGRGQDKNPLLAAIGIFFAITGAVVATANPIFGFYLIVGGLSLAAYGSGLLGPPQSPKDTDQPSPNYDFRAQGNRARIGEAIPVIYGEFKVYPDFIEQPYSRYEGDDCKQFLYYILGITQGECDVFDANNVKLGASVASNYQEITYRVYGEDATGIDLFEHNVLSTSEVSGQRLQNALTGPSTPGEWQGPFYANPESTTPKFIEVDVAFPRGQYGWAPNSGDLHAFNMQYEIQYRQEGENIAWSSRRVSRNALDKNPVCFTTRIPVNPAREEVRYQVRVRRRSAYFDNSLAATEMRFMALKTYLHDETDYSGITKIAMKLQATDNLSSQTARKVNLIVKRKIPTWSPAGGWGPNVFTKNPVWIACDILRNDVYGANLSDEHLDLPSLYTLAQRLDDEEYEFNGVFDRQISVWDALRAVCRAGRCAAVWQGGKFHMSADREQLLPSAMFSPSNMVKDTFSIGYQMPEDDEPDGIEIEFLDKEKDYKPEIIQAKPVYNNGQFSIQTGLAVSDQPERVKFMGCTDVRCATREVKYMVANQALRRKTIKFTTELEGFIPAFGDKVLVAHDVVDWGSSGQVVGGEVVIERSRVKPLIELSEPFEFEEGKSYCIVFRNSMGGVQQIPASISSGVGCPIRQVAGKPNHIELADIPLRAGERSRTWSVRLSNGAGFAADGKIPDDSFELRYIRTETGQAPVITKIYDIYTGNSKERTFYIIGEHDTVGQEAIVKSIRPRSDTTVELECLNEDSRVHTLGV